MADNLVLEGITPIFRNFSGLKSMYNEEGQRNFSVLMEDAELADKLIRDGWNLKPLKVEEGEEPRWHLPVKIHYASRRPPRIFKVRHNQGDTVLVPEHQLELFDALPIEYADVELNPYFWNVNGKSGIKAYCQTMYIIPEFNALDRKWEAWSLATEQFSQEELDDMDEVTARILGEEEV